MHRPKREVREPERYTPEAKQITTKKDEKKKNFSGREAKAEEGNK